MGYDMYQRTTPALAEESKERHERKIAEAQAALDQVADQAGSWFLPGEREKLTDEEAETAERALRSAKLEVLDSLTGPLSIGETRCALLKHKTVPASAEYIKRSRALDEAQLSDPEHSEYFRLNIWGMSTYRDVMYELGMLKDSFHDASWPELPDGLSEGANEALGEAVYDVSQDPDVTREGLVEAMKEFRASEEEMKYYKDVTITDADIEAYADFQLANMDYRSRNDESSPGIEVIKFCSNDGWVVTPQECASAVEIWEAVPEEKRAAIETVRTDYWALWIQFLEDGAAGTGFRVH